MIFLIPRRRTVPFGPRHTIKIVSIGAPRLEIAGPHGGQFAAVNNAVVLCGHPVPVRVTGPEVELELSEALQQRFGITEEALVSA